MQVVFEAPSKDSPGFLRRMKQAIAFQDAINKNQLTEQVLDNMVGFLAAYVKVPENRDEARDLLLDASETQFMEMLQSITGNTEQDDTKKNGNK